MKRIFSELKPNDFTFEFFYRRITNYHKEYYYNNHEEFLDTIRQHEIIYTNQNLGFCNEHHISYLKHKLIGLFYKYELSNIFNFQELIQIIIMVAEKILIDLDKESMYIKNLI